MKLLHRKQNSPEENKFRLRVGIVGCGRVARHHARFIQELKGVQLVGIADVNEEVARAFAAEYGIATVKRSVDALLDGEQLDVVHVVTPPAYHYQCARAALQRGVHVLLEKPMAFTAAEVSDLYELAHAAGVLLCPDFIHLFHPRMLGVRETLASGKLGRPVHVESRICINLDEEGTELREALGMHWSYLLPGGVLRDYASHALYLALYFAGWPDKIQVTSRSGGILPQGMADHVAAQINGSQCTAEVLISCAARPSCLTLSVLCEKGCIQVDFGTQTVLTRNHGALPRRLATVTSNFAESWQLSTSAAGNVVNYLRGKIVPYGGLRCLLPRFYKAVQNSSLPPVPRELAAAVAVAEETMFANSPRPAISGTYRASAQSGIRHSAKVLITGASGYIGTAVAQALVREGYYVRGLIRPTGSPEMLERLGVEIFYGDVRRFEDVNAAMAGMDVVVHLAAGLRGSPEFIVNTSVQGTQNLSRAALLRHAQRVIYISSMSVYDVAAMRNKQTITEDSPLEEKAETRGAYSLGKRRAEAIALARLNDQNPAWTILRPSIVVGNGADPVGAVGWMVGRNLVSLSSPRKRLLLIHVDDLAAAIVQTIQHDATKGKVYTLSHPDRISVREYVEACLRSQADGMRSIYIPYWCALLATVGGKVMKKAIGRGPSLNRRRLLSVYRNLNAGCERLRQDTGWQPTANLLGRLATGTHSDPAVDQAPIEQFTAGD